MKPRYCFVQASQLPAVGGFAKRWAANIPTASEMQRVFHSSQNSTRYGSICCLQELQQFKGVLLCYPWTPNSAVYKALIRSPLSPWPTAQFCKRNTHVLQVRKLRLRGSERVCWKPHKSLVKVLDCTPGFNRLCFPMRYRALSSLERPMKILQANEHFFGPMKSF